MLKSYFDDNFVQLPRGSFLMGSDDALAKEREKPVHEVHINYDVAMAKRQVTVEEYMLFAQATGADVPVRRVRYHDAKAYCAWKTERDGVTYRLPTEAEWEYACRTGNNGNYCFGDEVAEFGDYAWYADNSEGVTHDVGTKKPNAWGLYDMHGNVWEWCADWYSENYENTPTDGSAYTISNEKGRVLRGGSWNGSAENSRCSSRINLGSGGRNYFVGFRVLIEL